MADTDTDFPKEVNERLRPILTAYEAVYGVSVVTRLNAYIARFGEQTLEELLVVAAKHDADRAQLNLPPLDYVGQVERAKAEYDAQEPVS
jgi:hypothetical protein